MTNITFKEHSIQLNHIPPERMKPEIVTLCFGLSICFFLLLLLFWFHARLEPRDPINISIGLFIGLVGWVSTILLLFSMSRKNEASEKSQKNSVGKIQFPRFLKKILWEKFR